jgi:hypothetical protein
LNISWLLHLVKTSRKNSCVYVSKLYPTFQDWLRPHLEQLNVWTQSFPGAPNSGCLQEEILLQKAYDVQVLIAFFKLSQPKHGSTELGVMTYVQISTNVRDVYFLECNNNNNNNNRYWTCLKPLDLTSFQLIDNAPVICHINPLDSLK